MLRAAVLFVVLILALGPNAELLCKAWCHPPPDAANDCHHQESTNSPGLAGDNTCDHAVLGVGTFLREEVRPGALSSNADDAVVVPRYLLGQLTVEARDLEVPGREWALQKRPLSTSLRI